MEGLWCWRTSGTAVHVDVSLTRTTYLGILADHAHPLSLSEGLGALTQRKNGSGMVQQQVHGVNLASKFLKSQFN